MFYQKPKKVVIHRVTYATRIEKTDLTVFRYINNLNNLNTFKLFCFRKSLNLFFYNLFLQQCNI